MTPRLCRSLKDLKTWLKGGVAVALIQQSTHLETAEKAVTNHLYNLLYAEVMSIHVWRHS